MLRNIPKIRVVTCVLATLLGSGGPALADASALENRLRAAFLFNFARFTEWRPAHAREHINFCIAGAPDLLDAVKATVRGKTIRDKALQAMDASQVNVSRECDVLYLQQDQLNLIDQAKSSTLLVGEGTEFAARQGMVGFLLRDDRLRFAINPTHVEAGGLSMSAQLLNLADIVAPSGNSL